MWTKKFWFDALERAIRTAVQAPVAAWLTAKISSVYDINFKAAVGVMSFSFIMSIIMSIGGSQIGSETSASLVK